MGRGDKKTKKGKIWKGSFGNSRNKKAIKRQLKRNATKKPVEVTVADAAPKVKRTVTKKKEA